MITTGSSTTFAFATFTTFIACGAYRTVAYWTFFTYTSAAYITFIANRATLTRTVYGVIPIIAAAAITAHRTFTTTGVLTNRTGAVVFITADTISAD